MSALVSPYDVAASGGVNTGFEGEAVLGTAKGLILVPGGAKWAKSAMTDPVTFFKNKIHDAGSARFFPMLTGIFDFAVTKEGDVTEANPVQGTTRSIRLGGLTIVYTFEKGGLPLAKAMLGFFQKGYSFIPVDQEGKFMVKENTDGTLSGLKTNEITPSFSPTTATTAFKNILTVSTQYNDYVNAQLYKSDTPLDFMGLIEVETTSAGGQSTTKLRVNVKTKDKGTDLIAQYGSSLAVLSNFVVTNKATGAVVTPTAIAIVNGVIEITGTYTSGQTYNVKLAAPSVLLGNNIEGYAGETYGADILIS
jgi:hypothetical protein